MTKSSFIVFSIALSVSTLSAESTFISNKDISIYKNPKNGSELVKVIKAGEVVKAEDTRVNGFIPIIGGYAKEGDLTPVIVGDANNKSAKAIVERTLGERELPVSYVGTVNLDNANMKTCASIKCATVATAHKGDVFDIVGKTPDASWYKTQDGKYISGKSLDISFKSESVQIVVAKDTTVQNTELKNIETKKRDDKMVVKALPKEETVDFGDSKQLVNIESEKAEQSDDLYAHSGEIAKKYPNEALIRNLTKTPTPMPVKIPARYARALDFPILNKSGDVYTDYTFVWIKIKNEEFVLGKREGKTTGNQFTINKRID